jgi:putative ABC transport system permease protein
MRFVSDGFLDSWHEVLATVARNKLRSILTACGVFWGIFMLIVMLGIGKGLERGTQKNLGDMSVRSMWVWSQRSTMPYAGLSPGRFLKFQNADIEAVRAVDGVEHVAPRLRLGGWRDGSPVTASAKSGIFTVLGDYPDLAFVEALEVTDGRFVNARDLAEKRKIAVVGDEVRKVLFADANPVGRYVQIRGIHFLVVGEVLSHRGGDEGERVRSSVFIPFTTFQTAFNEHNRVGWFALTARGDASATEVERNVRATLIARHRVHPEDNEAIGSFNAAERFGKVNGLFEGIQVFVWFVGTLTLLAGVLGVSNILLITVKERTREFGIRKALGATPWNTVLMVLKESIALTALAGYVGMIAGVGALELIARAVSDVKNAPLHRPEVDMGVALIATLVLIASGGLAGIVPARHAARINPVEALRAE